MFPTAPEFLAAANRVDFVFNVWEKEGKKLRYGNAGATDEQCVAAAQLAGADDFIRRLPQGYETVLTGGGSSLSQGQRQLLSIARGAVADPPVMILDEGMDRLMAGRTVFVIAHRLSTVRNADLILVLDHGSVIERGSHSQLMEERGAYYRLCTGVFELE